MMKDRFQNGRDIQCLHHTVSWSHNKAEKNSEYMYSVTNANADVHEVMHTETTASIYASNSHDMFSEILGNTILLSGWFKQKFQQFHSTCTLLLTEANKQYETFSLMRMAGLLTCCVGGCYLAQKPLTSVNRHGR